MKKRNYSRLAALPGAVAALLLSAAAAVAAPPPSKEFSVEKPAADNSVEAERASFELRDGFEVNLFASEELGVSNPLAIRWDPRGRLWVLCTWAYPQAKPGDNPDDKIFILEDTDNDGVADTSKIFADGLNMPMGFALGHGGVYVGHGTELLHLADTDGDDRADQRRVLLRGFGTGDTHQNINSFAWGPAGELMFGQGLHCLSRVETPWGIERLDRAGVWRLWPKRLRLDPFLNNAMGPTNPWGTVFDDWGQPFIVSGAGRGIYYLLPAMIRTDHVEKIHPIALKNKLCGVDILSGRHLPEDLHGLMAVGHFWTNQVDLFELSEDGAGFNAKELQPLIRSTHKSFRPVDVKVGPDGAIYVADWFNPIVGHYQASFRHPDRDKTHGRIWRITAKDRPLVEKPELAGATAAQLLDQLDSPERWTRYQARRLLDALPTAQVKPVLDAWVELHVGDSPGVHERFERHLIDVVGVYQAHEIPAQFGADALLYALDPRARAYGARVLGQQAHLLGTDAFQSLRKAAADEHPRVRLEAVVALSYFPHAHAVEIATRALDHPTDPFIDYALTQTVHALKPHWLPKLEDGSLTFGGNAAHMAYVFQTDGSADVLAHVRKLVASPGLEKTGRNTLLNALANIGNPGDLRTVFDEAQSDANLLRELAAVHDRHGRMPSGDLSGEIKRLFTAGDPEISAAAIRLAGRWKLREHASLLKAVATNPDSNQNERLESFEALPRLIGKSASLPLNEILETETNPAIVGAALAALASLDLELATHRAAALLAAAGTSPNFESILPPIVSREGGQAALAAALDEITVDAATATAAAEWLNSRGRLDPVLRTRLHALAGVASDSRAYDPDFVSALAADAAASGDPARGKEIYGAPELACVACHKIGDTGGILGPDLSGIGRGLSTEVIVESVLWPKRQIKEGFLSTTITTKDGRVLTGYLQKEDRDIVAIRDIATNQEVTLARKQIKSRQDAGTIMPESLTATLSPEDLRDLIAFLASLGRD